MADEWFTKDPRRAKQFATRKDAVAAVKRIGWRISDAQPIDVMGFRLFAIMDEHCRLLTPSGFTELAKHKGAL